METDVRTAYDNDIKHVSKDLLNMGDKVVIALQKAIDALKQQDERVAAEVVFNDKEIDDMQIAIEDKTIELIAMQQPVAKDLRIIASVFKTTTDLERIGDHAKKIAKIANRLSHVDYMKPLIDIPLAAELSMEMVRKALRSFLEMDAKLAMEVIAADDRVDEICSKCKNDIFQYMLEDRTNIPQGTELNKIVHRLERIGDHAANMAEWVVYLATGKRVNV